MQIIMNHPHYHSMLATKPPEYQTFVDLRKVRLFAVFVPRSVRSLTISFVPTGGDSGERAE